MRRFFRLTAALVAVLIAVPPAASWLAWRREPPGEDRSAGPNAAWAGHTWVGDVRPERDYERLVERLRQAGMTDLFVHVGPLEADGSIPPGRFPEAPKLLQALEGSGLRVQAWIGQIERRGGGPLDLDDAAVRDRIVETAALFVDLGFDGIHYDIEPWFPGDERFLALLDDTALLDGLLSVSTNEIDIFPGQGPALRTVLPRAASWTPAYYREVAARVDQIAVMTYDTALPRDWLFGPFVARQVELISAAVGPGTIVFFGVASYDEPSIGHWPAAENVADTVRGVRLGLRGLDAEQRADIGIGLYAEWTTTPDEWAVIRRDWLGPTS